MHVSVAGSATTIYGDGKHGGMTSWSTWEFMKWAISGHICNGSRECHNDLC